MSGQECQECIAGKYKNLTDDSACVDCPTFSHSSSASIALADCVCNAGYSGENGSTCTACDSAIYSPIIKGLTCQPDINGQYTYLRQHQGADLYQNSKGVYLYKPQSAWNYLFAKEIHINAFWNENPKGYKTLGRTYVKNAVNAADMPRNIPERCFRSGASLTSGQSDYPARKNAFNPNLIACACDLGRTLSPEGVCEPCTAGKYRSLIDDTTCVDCPMSSSSLSGSAACFDCPVSYEASVLTSAFSDSGKTTGCIKFL